MSTISLFGKTFTLVFIDASESNKYIMPEDGYAYILRRYNTTGSTYIVPGVRRSVVNPADVGRSIITATYEKIELTTANIGTYEDKEYCVVPDQTSPRTYETDPATCLISDFVLMGLPQSGSRFYTEISTATELPATWLSDGSKYSKVRVVCNKYEDSDSDKLGVVFPNCNNVYLSHIRFEVEEGTELGEHSALNFVNSDTTSYHGCNMFIEHSCFTTANYNRIYELTNLDSKTYSNYIKNYNSDVEESETITTRVNSEYVFINDCEIDHCGEQSDRVGFTFDNTKLFIIKGSTIYSGTSNGILNPFGMNEPTSVIYFPRKNSNMSANILNSRRIITLLDGGQYANSSIAINGCKSINISGFTDSQASAISNVKFIVRPCICVRVNTNCGSVKNCIFKYPSIMGITSCALRIDNINKDINYEQYHACGTNQFIIVSGITVTCSQAITNTETYGTDISNNVNPWWLNQGEYSTGLLDLRYTTKLYSYEFTNAGASMYDGYWISNITFDAPYGNVLHAVRSSLDFKNSTINGSIKLRSCTGIIGSLKNNYTCGALYDAGSNLLYIDNISCDAVGYESKRDTEHDSAIYFAIDADFRSTIVVGDSNVTLITDSFKLYEQGEYVTTYEINSDFTNYRSNYYSCLGKDGNSLPMLRTFFERLEFDAVVDIKTSEEATDSYRVLRYTNSSGRNDGNPAIIGDNAFKSISYTTTSDVTAVSFEVCFEEAVADINEHVNIRLEIGNNTYYSSLDAQWIDSPMIWSVTGGYAKRCTFNLSLAEGTTIKMIYSLNYYNSNGKSLYICPYPICE